MTTREFVPVLGRVRPGMAFCTLLTIRETLPVPPLAAIVWLYAVLIVSAGNVVGLRVIAGLTVML